MSPASVTLQRMCMYDRFIGLGIPADLATKMADQCRPLDALLEYEFLSATDAILCFACWHDTVEGHRFWADVLWGDK